MAAPGQVVLLRFPQTDQTGGKLRPALVLRDLPGKYDDWLICMISSQLPRHIQGLDEIMMPEDSDFEQSGLKLPSAIRGSRMAVVAESILLGKIGEIAPERLHKLRENIANWIKGPL